MTIAPSSASSWCLAVSMAVMAPFAVGCTVLTGFSLESNLGATYYDHVAGDAAKTGVGLEAGLTFSIEYDYNRSASMGLGLGPRALLLPTTAGRAEKTGLGNEYWLGAALGGFHRATVRPRAYVGAAFQIGEEFNFFNGYLGAGASLHPSRGRMWHLFAGPQYTVAGGDDIGGANGEYRGWGVFGRIRYLRMFFSSCDRYIDPSSRDGLVTVDELCRGDN